MNTLTSVIPILVFVLSLPCRPVHAAEETSDFVRSGIQWAGNPIASFSTDNGITYGLLARRFNYGAPGVRPFETLLTLQGRYSTRGPHDVLLSFEQTGIGRLNLRMNTELQITSNDSTPYFGVGDSTAYTNELASQGAYYYSTYEISAAHSVRKSLAPGLDLETAITATSIQSESNGPGTVYENTHGAEPLQSYYTALRLGLVHERRDSEFVTSRGSYASAFLTASPSWFGELRSWTRLDLDYRRYDPLVTKRWLWLATQLRYSSASEAAPLSYKARLGSLGTLRGLPFNRFLSDHSLSFRTELRSVWLRETVFKMPFKLGTGVFVDTGKIGDSFSRLASTPLHWAYGFSIFGSYFTDDFIQSADLGFSREGTAIYLRLGHAF